MLEDAAVPEVAKARPLLLLEEMLELPISGRDCEYRSPNSFRYQPGGDRRGLKPVGEFEHSVCQLQPGRSTTELHRLAQNCQLIPHLPKTQERIDQRFGEDSHQVTMKFECHAHLPLCC